MTPIEQLARSRAYSTSHKAWVIDLSPEYPGLYALFSHDNSAGASLLTIGPWHELEPHFLSRPTYTRQPRASKAETRKNLTEKILADLGL